MLEWLAFSKSILLSKTVWTAVAGVVVATVNATGGHLTNEQLDPIITDGLFGLTMLFRYLAVQPVHVIDPKL